MCDSKISSICVAFSWLGRNVINETDHTMYCGNCEFLEDGTIRAEKLAHAKIHNLKGQKGKLMRINWNAEAEEYAGLIVSDTAEPVVKEHFDRIVIAARSGYVDHPIAQDWVKRLRKHLGSFDVPTLGFGTSEDGKAWGMVVQHEDIHEIKFDVVHTAAQAMGRAVDWLGEVPVEYTCPSFLDALWRDMVIADSSTD